MPSNQQAPRFPLERNEPAQRDEYPACRREVTLALFLQRTENNFEIQLMSEPFAESTAPSSNQQAANDLRAAASGKTPDITDSAEEKAKLLKESAAEKARELRNNATETSRQVRELANQKALQFRDNAGENVQHLRSAATEQWQDTRIKLREFHADTESLIRQHPTHTVIAAVVTGFLVGLVIRR